MIDVEALVRQIVPHIGLARTLLLKERKTELRGGGISSASVGCCAAPASPV